MTAAILDMAALASPCIKQRAQPVGSQRRGGRGNPKLAEQGVSQLEGLFFLERQIGTEVGQGIPVDQLGRRAGAALHHLEFFRGLE